MQRKNHINTNSFYWPGVIMNALREMFYIFYTFRCIIISKNIVPQLQYKTINFLLLSKNSLNLIRVIFITSTSIDDFWMILYFIVMRRSVIDVKAFAMHQPRQTVYTTAAFVMNISAPVICLNNSTSVSLYFVEIHCV